MCFKKIFVKFLSYKDNTDVLDNYENNLNQLLNEQGFVTSIIEKLQTTVFNLELLVNEHFNNNTNYERKFYLDEKAEVAISRGKFDRLKAGLD